MNVFHRSDSAEWGTPEEYLDAARHVLGGIDLDPASDAEWNKVVKATTFYTAEEDGLRQPWAGNVWLNAPGGKVGNKSLAGLFWCKLMYEVTHGLVNHAIVAAFNLNALQQTQTTVWRSMCDFPLCVPRKRVRWVDSGGDAKAPPHASAFVYVPGILDYTRTFVSVFGRFGAVMNRGGVNE